jgi:hypothetical protein
VRPPEGEIAIVFSDITRAASLWEFNAEAMRDATLLHNELMRSLLNKHRGYEVIFIRYLLSSCAHVLRTCSLEILTHEPVLLAHVQGQEQR